MQTSTSTTLRYTPIAALALPAGAALASDEATVRALHEEVRLADERWRGALLHGLDHDLVRDLVRDYIDATYAYQRARYGKISMRLSVAAILRGGAR
jgi:hypothetical protein